MPAARCTGACRNATCLVCARLQSDARAYARRVREGTADSFGSEGQRKQRRALKVLELAPHQADIGQHQHVRIDHRTAGYVRKEGVHEGLGHAPWARVVRGEVETAEEARGRAVDLRRDERELGQSRRKCAVG